MNHRDGHCCLASRSFVHSVTAHKPQGRSLSISVPLPLASHGSLTTSMLLIRQDAAPLFTESLLLNHTDVPYWLASRSSDHPVTHFINCSDVPCCLAFYEVSLELTQGVPLNTSPGRFNIKLINLSWKHGK
jgi:hypothetical protein